MNITQSVQEVVRAILEAATEGKKNDLTLRAGDLHSLKFKDRMPICCSAMRNELRDGDEILKEPPKGNGTRLKIRYKLPRE